MEKAGRERRVICSPVHRFHPDFTTTVAIRRVSVFLDVRSIIPNAQFDTKNNPIKTVFSVNIRRNTNVFQPSEVRKSVGSVDL